MKQIDLRRGGHERTPGSAAVRARTHGAPWDAGTCAQELFRSGAVTAENYLEIADWVRRMT